jgi:hypothetical protein
LIELWKPAQFDAATASPSPLYHLVTHGRCLLRGVGVGTDEVRTREVLL